MAPVNLGKCPAGAVMHEVRARARVRVRVRVRPVDLGTLEQ